MEEKGRKRSEPEPAGGDQPSAEHKKTLDGESAGGERAIRPAGERFVTESAQIMRVGVDDEGRQQHAEEADAVGRPGRGGRK
jgi:hypothetical protein